MAERQTSNGGHPVVGVLPAHEHRQRAGLFAALADAFAVDFEPVDDPDRSGLDGLVVLGGRPVGGPARRLVYAGGGDAAGRVVDFGRGPGLDARLRGQALQEDATPTTALPADGDVLASNDGGPVWLRHGDAHTVGTAPPAELEDGEYLRSRLEPSRFLALVPLVQFLREVAGDAGWRPPPLRASFVVDDPNLHWPTYGHIRYPELARHAREHGYHIVMAMVPLDAWYANPRAVRLFEESADVISLCFHGNDHRRSELARPATREQALRVLGSAIVRMRRFERRTGLPVSRVMVPPHEACSAATLAAMIEVGFEAACTTRPAPWLPFAPPYSPYSSPRPENPLSSWRAAELTEHGFPVLLRRGFDEHDDVVLRAFLDQPLILYGHAEDFADGLDPLVRAAGLINSLPDVTWASLEDVATANAETLRRGSELLVRPLARRVRLRLEPGVESIVPAPLDGIGGFQEVVAMADGAALPGADGAIRLPQAAAEVELRWRPQREVEPASVAGARLDGRTVARRLVVHARDRLAPLRARAYRRP